ncbi:hypothetical protein GCM10027072_36300 [Streptomyces bullii]
MLDWIKSFSDEVRRLTGRRPVICTTTHSRNLCTAAAAPSAPTTPFGSPAMTRRPGALPAGWSTWTLWQYGNGGTLPGDKNLFNGSLDRLKKFARGA